MPQSGRINNTLVLLTPEEVQDALWMVGVWERWDMPAEEAAEWRRRILARQRFLELEADSPATNRVTSAS